MLVEKFTGIFASCVFELYFYLRKTGVRVTKRIQTLLSMIKKKISVGRS